MDFVGRIEWDMEAGEAEGQWESAILEQLGEEGKGNGEWVTKGEGKDWGEAGTLDYSVWSLEAGRAKAGLWDKAFEEQREMRVLTERMMGIVERERELWEQERRERKDLKRGRPKKRGRDK